MQHLSEEKKAALVRTNKAKITETLADIFFSLDTRGVKHNFHAFYDSRTKEYVAVIKFNGDDTEHKHKDCDHLITQLLRVIAPTLPMVIIETKRLKKERREVLKKKQRK